MEGELQRWTKANAEQVAKIVMMQGMADSAFVKAITGATNGDDHLKTVPETQ